MSAAGAVRILGVDPGSRITGFGIIQVARGRARYVASGCLRLGAGPMSERLAEIFSHMSAIVNEYRPQQMAIESVFVRLNPSSALKLGQARGVAIAAAVAAGLPVAEYSPTAVKQAVVGTGRADKAQVQHMVARLLALGGPPQADAADALAVALCHAHHGRSTWVGR